MSVAAAVLVAARKWSECAIVAAIALLAVGPATADAQTVAEFYKDRQITLIVGFNPGGGFDAYARGVSRHMGRHIPGNPAIIVKHQPGAGSIIAANYLYNAAPKDGSEIGLVADTAAIDALLGTVRTQFDAHRFTWIGSASRSISVCVAWHTVPVRTAQDLFEKELVVGTTGTSTITYPMALRSVLGLKLKLVGGYAGTSGLMLALERREIDAMCGQVYDAVRTQRPEWLEKGLVRTVIQLGLEKVPMLGDAPWAMDLARSDEDRRVLGLVVGSTMMGRPFLAPPGIPADRRDALRRAFMATMADPQLLSEAEKLRIDVSPISGEEIERFVTDAYATPQPIIERAKAILSVK
jgi:tripartite-type tricarboxylate transporter receptor subunit TctC